MCDRKRSGVLTRETMSALRHTLKTMVCLCKYLLVQLHFKYVLTGKFQTDCLEYRFAQYRGLSGTTYHVSVREIIESEKKLKLLSVLSLKSASFGRVSISQFSKDCSVTNSVSAESVSVTANKFVTVLQELESVTVSTDETHVLVYIAGYAGHKLNKSTSCVLCIEELLSSDDMSCDVETNELIYLHALDRGGLKWPRQILVDIVTKVFCIFQRLLSSTYEKLFMNVSNHKELTVHMCVEFLNTQARLDSVCECGRSLRDLLKHCASKMANILLNNYCKRLNDAAICAKSQKGPNEKKSRKLATLKSS